VFFADETAL
jgi:long-chain-fatty-acid--CoA ligase ACSBG